jgi:hypothetical protein
MTKHQFKVGDRVRLAAAFLDSIHDFNKATRRQQGWVTHCSSFPEFQLVTVQWDHGGTSKSLSFNLDL